MPQSLLENLQPLTPDVAEDAEDFQAVESMTVHGVYRAGKAYCLLHFAIYLNIHFHFTVFMI